MPPNQKPTLDIHPHPFKPSHLSLPPSPLSPQTPLQSCPPRQRSITLPIPDTRYVPPPPPLKWLWQCHQCRRTYSLGVTRRCLEDGHSFCAGTTTVKSWRRSVRPVRAKRHRACASEFDYQGWKAWGRWKRSGKEEEEMGDEVSLSSGESESSSSDGIYDDDDEGGKEEDTCGSTPLTKDCWTMCDYPSECRWGSRLGVHSPVGNHNLQIPTLPPISSPASPQVQPQVQLQPQPQPQTPTPPTTFEDILKPEESCKKGGRGEKADFWNALVASATRRKYVAPSSPLAGESSSGADMKEGGGVERDKDGDVVMGEAAITATASSTSTSTSTNQATVPPPSMNTAPLTISSSVTSLRDIIRKGTKRGKSSSKVPVVGENRSARVANMGLHAGSESRGRGTVHGSEIMRTGTQNGDVDDERGDVRTSRLWEIGKAL